MNMKLTQDCLHMHQRLLQQDKVQLRMSTLEADLKKKDEYVRLLLERNKELSMKIDKMKTFYILHQQQEKERQREREKQRQNGGHWPPDYSLAPFNNGGYNGGGEESVNGHYLPLPCLASTFDMDSERVFLSMPDVMGQQSNHNEYGSYSATYNESAPSSISPSISSGTASSFPSSIPSSVPSSCDSSILIDPAQFPTSSSSYELTANNEHDYNEPVSTPPKRKRPQRSYCSTRKPAKKSSQKSSLTCSSGASGAGGEALIGTTAVDGFSQTNLTTINMKELFED